MDILARKKEIEYTTTLFTQRFRKKLILGISSFAWFECALAFLAQDCPVSTSSSCKYNLQRGTPKMYVAEGHPKIQYPLKIYSELDLHNYNRISVGKG